MEQTQEQEAEAAAQEVDAELPEDNDGARDFIRGVGKQFQVARLRAGFTQQQAAERLNYGVDMIASVERGRRTPTPELLVAADKLFDAGGLLAAVAEDLQKARNKTRVRHPAWYRQVAAIEAKAVEIHSYQTMVIPGLLQTEAYARAAHRARRPQLDEATIEKRVADRLDRQKVLTVWPPPHASFVIEESVLRRPLGGREVHRGQLHNLLRVGELRDTEVQVMPMACEEHPDLEGPFALFTPKGKPQVAYVESYGRGHIISDAEEVRVMAAWYGSIRAHALTPRESVALIEKMLGDL
jgi:transcriptional regulator with XRE-family HTH domain